MTEARPKSAAIYCRLSYAPDGSLEKVERQEADCRALAERLGWPISDAHVYPDNSRSAWQRNRKRPAWDRMLAAIEAGEVDAILTYHGDRLMRQPWDLEKLLGIADQKNIRLASVSGTRNLDSPDDRFILRIEVAQACRESDNTSRRVQRGHVARVTQKGLTSGGGRRPFGFGVPTGKTRTRIDRATEEEIEEPILDLTQHVPTEAKILKEAAKRLLAGASQGAVVAWMNEPIEGSPRCTTTEGNSWTARGLRHLMLSPRIAGLIEHQGELYEAAWQPIVSREMWESLRAYYERGARENPYPGRERRYMLSGVAECSTEGCDGRTRVKPSGGRNRKSARIYYCGGCRRFGRNVEHLDAYVSGRVVWLLNSKALLAELDAAARDDGGVGDELAVLEQRKSELQERIKAAADHPDLDPLLAMQAVASYERRISELRNRLAVSVQARLVTRYVGITRERWEAEQVDARAAVVRALYRVVLKPATWRGPGFDPSSVELIRRPLASG